MLISFIFGLIQAILVTDSVNQKGKTSDTNSLDKKEEKLRTLVMYHEEQKRPEKLYNLVPGQSDKSPNIVFGVLKAVGSCSVHLFGHLISETDPLANFGFDFVQWYRYHYVLWNYVKKYYFTESLNLLKVSFLLPLTLMVQVMLVQQRFIMMIPL